MVEGNSREDCSRVDSLEIASHNYNMKVKLNPLDYHGEFIEIMKIPSQLQGMNFKNTQGH